MGADVEVGERGAPTATASSVADEALPCEERRLPRQGKSKEVLLREGVLELLDPLEADRDLGVDERVDGQRRPLGALREGLPRPGGPSPVLGEDVEQDVAVDEDGQRRPRVNARISSVVIRTDPLPRMRCTIDFPRRLGSPYLPDPNRLTDDLDFHLGVGQHAEPLPDLDGDGHLTLGGDLHGITSTTAGRCAGQVADDSSRRPCWLGLLRAQPAPDRRLATT
jgi:hypothetical protein